MLVNRLTVTTMLCALQLASLPRAHAQATEAQPLAEVRAAAERGVRRELDPHLSAVQLTAGTLDARLRLAACASPLDVHALAPRGTQARVLARVACTTGNAWSINVPVDIHRTHNVLVLRRALGRGEAISAADVVVNSRVLPGIASPFVGRVEDLAGRLTRQAIPEGTALTADSLSAPLLIHRGQSVTLAAATAGIEVRAPGRAMSDAAANQRVRVQNLNSLKIVEGVAETQEVVRVSP
jgi:flagella basal body P-ring formation protein FlgA